MRTQLPECSVIIPVFNKWELTRNCLASLHEHTTGHDLEIIVVDNGSSDATATELAPYGKALFGDRFSAIVFPENRNFGPACNAGARAAASPMLFFLNNDTVMTPGWFPPLMEAMREEDGPAAVGPLLLYENGSVQHMGVAYGTQGPFHLYQHFPADHPVVFRKRELQAITGAAFMIRADLFRECGEFYEEYRNGFEDMDLCVQIRRHGGKFRCVVTSRIYHLEGQSTGRASNNDKNGLILSSRCADYVYVDMHHHALRDGFAVFVNDLLTISIKLKAKDEVSLITQAQGKDAETWLRLVAAHPYWLYGREVLAQSMERAGQYSNALQLRVELVEIEPVMKRYNDLLQLAPYEEDAPWAAAARRHLDTITQLKADYTYTVAAGVVKKIQNKLKNDSTRLLEDLFDAKLREWFPNKHGA